MYPFGSQYGSTIFTHGEWMENKDFDYDYGAIILPDTFLSDQVGYFGFRQENDDWLQSTTINKSGYPGGPTNGRRHFFKRVVQLTKCPAVGSFISSIVAVDRVVDLFGSSKMITATWWVFTTRKCTTVGPNGAVRVQSSVMISCNACATTTLETVILIALFDSPLGRIGSLRTSFYPTTRS